MKQTKSFEIDMCNGTLMDKLISFSIPLMLSGILQLMFNAVDIIVVGRFAGSESLAAVGFDNAFTFIYSVRTGTPAAAMEQVPEEEVHAGFDRVLEAVQETARKQVARLQGQTLTALVEEVNEQDASLVTGRLSNNTIVHFPGSADLIGQIVPVKLEECHGFYYTGHRVEETK